MVCPYLVEMDIVIMDKHTKVKYDTYDVVDVCYEHGKIRAYTNILELIRGEKRP